MKDVVRCLQTFELINAAAFAPTALVSKIFTSVLSLFDIHIPAVSVRHKSTVSITSQGHSDLDSLADLNRNWAKHGHRLLLLPQ